MRIKHILRVFAGNILPKRMYYEICYYYVYRRKLSFKNPKAFSEKIYWLKRYYEKHQTELIQKCYDKYNVRDYIIEKIGEKYLNELYGVYEDVDDIDFSSLPQKYVLKITQSSGANIICPDKSKLDVDSTKFLLNKWLTEAKSNKVTGEDYYFDNHPRIICEKFLENENGQVPEDYRLYCFNGKVHFIVCDFGTTNDDGSHGDNIIRNVYNLNWELIDIELGRPNNKSINFPKPDGFEEMIKIAEALSSDFPFVRVDLYNVKGKWIFGELTWIPMGGNCPINPDEYDFILGDSLILPSVKL